MTATATLVARGFREGNLIPVGTLPTDAELDEGLANLVGYVSGVFGMSMGEQLIDWLAPAPQRTASVAANAPQLPYPMSQDANLMGIGLAPGQSPDFWPYPPKNSRIVFGGVDTTVYFPEQPDPGSRMAIVQGSGAGDGGIDGSVLTLDGNGRFIEGDPQQTFTAPVTVRQWMYREDLGNWIAFVPPTLADADFLFPADFDDLFVCALAMRMAPHYGKTTAPETQSTFTLMNKTFKARYRQSAPTIYGSQDFPRSAQSYIAGRWYW